MSNQPTEENKQTQTASPVQSVNHSKHQIQSAKEVFELQKRCFDAMPYPSRALRCQQLKALRAALLKYQEKLTKALSADFGYRADDESTMVDILPVIRNIDYSIKHLKQWMTYEKRHIDWTFQPAKGGLVFQPLGVIGIIGAWNYPVFLTLGPLVAAIAAGNRAMIKPSEMSPYTNRVINEIIQDAFTKDEVYIVEGEVEVSVAFSQLAFDHLLFTGSTAVGKKVMAAAAENLTPVTLELGGKSPVIIGSDVTAEFAVERLVFGKNVNGGQTCVAPDYILCPKAMVGPFIDSFKKRASELYPNKDTSQLTSIINDDHFNRLQSALNHLRESNTEVISLDNHNHSERSMPLHLVVDPPSDSEVMQTEIFGPILPILSFDTLDEAFNIIAQHPRPLALYLFTHDQSLIKRVQLETHSGTLCINETVVHFAQEDLPMGGLGYSGMGQYHGKEGFLTFSHAKPVFKRGKIYPTRLVFPPYGRSIHRLIKRLFM